MQTDPAEIESVLKLLAASPRRIAAASQGLTRSRLQARTAAEPWSANDIVAHLRACAEVWGKTIQIMLTQDHPTLRYVSPRSWMKKSGYMEWEFQASLQAFTEQRQALLKTLKALPRSDWSRGATFTGTSARQREQTILTYAQRMVNHEQPHCEQLEALLK